MRFRRTSLLRAHPARPGGWLLQVTWAPEQVPPGAACSLQTQPPAPAAEPAPEQGLQQEAQEAQLLAEAAASAQEPACLQALLPAMR